MARLLFLVQNDCGLLKLNNGQKILYPPKISFCLLSLVKVYLMKFLLLLVLFVCLGKIRGTINDNSVPETTARTQHKSITFRNWLNFAAVFCTKPHVIYSCSNTVKPKYLTFMSFSTDLCSLNCIKHSPHLQIHCVCNTNHIIHIIIRRYGRPVTCKDMKENIVR